MTHGSLFFLHSEDEKLLLREIYSREDLTFFKHGCDGVCGDEGRLSIGFVFRVSVHSVQVHADTGTLVLDDAQNVAANRFLSDFMKTDSKVELDANTKKLWRSVKDRFFS